MSKGDGNGDSDGGWLFAIMIFVGGLLLLIVCQQRLPGLATVGVILAIIGAIGIFTKLRDVSS